MLRVVQGEGTFTNPSLERVPQWFSYVNYVIIIFALCFSYLLLRYVQGQV